MPSLIKDETGDRVLAAEAARECGMSVPGLMQRILRGDLPAVRVGKSVLIERADLDRFKAARAAKQRQRTA